jgi:predicted DNA-binding transcriptional regulator AlpA
MTRPSAISRLAPLATEGVSSLALAKATNIGPAQRHWALNTGIDPLLTSREAMGELGLSRASFYRRIKDGTIPGPVKLGCVSCWPASEIMAVVEAAKARRAVGG